MTGRSPKTVRVDDDLWDEFESFVAEAESETRGAKPKHLETALREYLNKTRMSKVEERQDRMEDKLDEALTLLRDNSTTHTHTTSEKPESIQNVEEIASIATANADDEVFRDPVVERAIQEVAGADDRTIAKYKGLLKERDLLYDHPSDSAVWTTSQETWINWCTGYIDGIPDATISEVIEDYGITHDEYIEAYEELEEAESEGVVANV